MLQHSEDMELVVQQEGPVVQVTLNRPGALNALSLEMIRMLSAGLSRWEEDPKVKAVFIDGAGGKAFCSGGDVKSAYRTGMAYRRGDADERVVALFFGEEYHFNRQLYHYKKPLFAFMNGITMGGGFGVAGPCRYRIASENTVFAMPEVGIGFFPDVGSMYYLTRAPGEAGAWLALTGQSIGPGDMLECGFASHYIPAESQADCRAQLIEAFAGKGRPEDVLARFHSLPQGGGVLKDQQALIDQCFSGDKLRHILERLRQNGAGWGGEQVKIMQSRSPMSLLVTLAHLRLSRGMSFDQVTAQDFMLAQHFLRRHDFYEGVRAALVDKDRQPRWEPQSLEEITPAMVQDYFSPAGLALDEIAA